MSFHHHEVVGAKMARKRMRALRYSKQSSTTLPHWWSCTCASTATADGEWTDSAVRRYVRDAGDRCCRGCTS